MQDVLLMFFFAVFFLSNVIAFMNGQFSSVPFAVENGLLLGIYVTRRRSMVTSPQVRDWLWAFGGGWLPLAMQVGGDASVTVSTIGIVVQTLGLTLTVIGMGFLGRSFGIVAANRGLKTGGTYGIVRHPIYAAHLVTQAGLILANPLAINAAIFTVTLICQVKRMDAEERVLTESADYSAYKDRVRFRLLPGVY